MRKILLSVFTFFVAFSATSQLETGTWLVGGSGSLYSYNYSFTSASNNITDRLTTIDLSASVGYFITNKLTAGLRPKFYSFKAEGYNTPTSTGGGQSNEFRYYVGPFVRYYFLNTDINYNVLADVNYNFGANKILLEPKGKGKFNSFSVMAGPELFFNTSVGVELLFGYLRTEQSIDNTPAGYVNVRKGFQTSIGFHFHLQKL